MDVIPYLTFDGRCEEAFGFYAGCLGGEITMLSTYGDSPMAGQMPPDWASKVIHARLSVGGRIVMGSDAPPSRYAIPTGIQMSLMVETAEEADRVFAPLAEGGRIDMPLQEMFWAIRFGMLVDRYAIPWMVNCENQTGSGA